MAIIERLKNVNNIGLWVTLILMVLLMSIFFPMFLTPINIEILAMGFIQEAIMALGMTLIIISGGIDLSIAGVLPFSAIMVGIFMNKHLPVPLAIILTLLLAIGIGFVNALIINKLRVHPFIATLSTLTTIKGVNLVITKGESIYGFPKSFYFLGQGRIAGIPFPIILFFVLAVIMAYLLKNHHFFQQIYFIGNNVAAAKFSGINVKRVTTFIYMLSSFLAGIAGIITASQYISANTGFGLNVEMRVITAVIIGGASLAGGKGNIGGTLLGVLFLAIINNAFVQTGAPTYWQEVVYGGMLLVAIFLEEYISIKKSGNGLYVKRWKEFLG